MEHASSFFQLKDADALQSPFANINIIVTGPRRSGCASLVDRFVYNSTSLPGPKHELRVRFSYVRNLAGVDNTRLRIVQKRTTLVTTPFSNQMFRGICGAIILLDLTCETGIENTVQVIRVCALFLMQQCTFS